MDYKQQVINSAEEKHQDLLSGKTEPVIRTDLKLDSSATYAENRKKFVQRTEKERKEFNNAIERAKQNSNYRGRDKATFGGIITTFIIFVLLMGVIIGLNYGMEDVHGWMEAHMMPQSGLSFNDMLSGNPDTMAQKVCYVISVLGSIALFIVFLCVLDIENCLGKLIASSFLAGLGSAILMVVLQLLVHFGGYALYYLFHLYGIAALCLLTVILILIIGRKTISAKYKRRKWIMIAITLALAGATVLINGI